MHTSTTYRQLASDAEYIAECQSTQEAREWWQRRAARMYEAEQAELEHGRETRTASASWGVGDTLWLGRIQAELEFDAGSGVLDGLDMVGAADWLQPMWLSAYQACEMVGDVPMRFDRVGQAVAEADTLYEYEAARRVAGAVALLVYGGERREDEEA